MPRILKILTLIFSLFFLSSTSQACLNPPTTKTYNSFFNNDPNLPKFEITFSAHGLLEIDGKGYRFDSEKQAWCVGETNFECKKVIEGDYDAGNGITLSPFHSKNPDRYFFDIIHKSKPNEKISIEAVVKNGRVISTNVGRYNGRWIGPIYEEINGVSTGKRDSVTGNITGALATRGFTIGGADTGTPQLSASAERVASTCGGDTEIPAATDRGGAGAIRK